MATPSLVNRDNLYDQAYFNRHKEFLTAMAKRMGFDLSVISVRLRDHHLLPGETLVQFSRALGKAVRDVLRSTDLAFQENREQWEFAIFLPGANRKYSGFVKGRLRYALGQYLGKLDDELVFDLQTEVLARRELMNLSNDGSESNSEESMLFARQKRLLVGLAERLDFPLSLLSLQVTNYEVLTDAQLERFETVLDRVFSAVLDTSDRALFFQEEGGQYRIMAPGVDESVAKQLVMSILKVIEQNKEAVPLRFGYQIEALHRANEQD